MYLEKNPFKIEIFSLLLLVGIIFSEIFFYNSFVATNEFAGAFFTVFAIFFSKLNINKQLKILVSFILIFLSVISKVHLIYVNF